MTDYCKDEPDCVVDDPIHRLQYAITIELYVDMKYQAATQDEADIEARAAMSDLIGYAFEQHLMDEVTDFDWKSDYELREPITTEES